MAVYGHDGALCEHCDKGEEPAGIKSPVRRRAWSGPVAANLMRE